MMQGARGIDAGLAGHASQIPASHLLVNKETTSLFPHFSPVFLRTYLQSLPSFRRIKPLL
jgi:hypothetical protein